jgi:hypothetical protein
MAPEFLEDRNVLFTTKTEIYSFGILLWEIFCARAEGNVLGEPYP